MAYLNDNLNFKSSGLYLRVVELMGGSQSMTDRWWTTPLPYAPFNLRAPETLMNEDEWNLDRIFIESTRLNSGMINNYGAYLSNYQSAEPTMKAKYSGHAGSSPLANKSDNTMNTNGVPVLASTMSGPIRP